MCQDLIAQQRFRLQTSSSPASARATEDGHSPSGLVHTGHPVLFAPGQMVNIYLQLCWQSLGRVAELVEDCPLSKHCVHLSLPIIKHCAGC